MFHEVAWLIYLASVVTGLGNFCLFLATIGCIGFIAYLIMMIVVVATSDESEETKKVAMDIKKMFGKTFIPLMICGVVGASLIPDKQTIALIAASEITQQIVDNPKVKDLVDPSFDYLRSWIKQQADAQAKAAKSDK